MSRTIKTNLPFSAILTKVFDRVHEMLINKSNEVRTAHASAYGTRVVSHQPFKEQLAQYADQIKQLEADRGAVIQGLSSWLKPREIPLEEIFRYPRRVYSTSFLTDHQIPQYSDPPPGDETYQRTLEIMDMYLGVALVYGIPE